MHINSNYKPSLPALFDDRVLELYLYNQEECNMIELKFRECPKVIDFWVLSFFMGNYLLWGVTLAVVILGYYDPRRKRLQ